MTVDTTLLVILVFWTRDDPHDPDDCDKLYEDRSDRDHYTRQSQRLSWCDTSLGTHSL